MGKLVVVRHGNTFEGGQPSRMVGKTEDVPLVARGEEQSRMIGEALRGVAVAEVVTSPAIRCRRMGELIIEAGELDVSARVDTRLGELDYGQWAGLTDAEVLERFGERAVLAWRHEGVWPSVGEWGDSPREVAAEVASLLEDMAQGDEFVRVLVPHGGRARFFHEAMFGDRAKALKTGQAAVLEWSAGRTEWDVLGWDVDAARLRDLMTRNER